MAVTRRGAIAALFAIPAATAFGLTTLGDEAQAEDSRPETRLVLSAGWSRTHVDVLFRDGGHQQYELAQEVISTVEEIEAKDVPLPYLNIQTNEIVTYGLLNPRLDRYDLPIKFTKVVISLGDVVEGIHHAI